MKATKLDPTFALPWAGLADSPRAIVPGGTTRVVYLHAISVRHVPLATSDVARTGGMKKAVEGVSDDARQHYRRASAVATGKPVSVASYSPGLSTVVVRRVRSSGCGRPASS